MQAAGLGSSDLFISHYNVWATLIQIYAKIHQLGIGPHLRLYVLKYLFLIGLTRYLISARTRAKHGKSYAWRSLIPLAYIWRFLGYFCVLA